MAAANKRSSLMLMLALALGAVLLLAAVGGGIWATRRVGASCDDDGDCNSHRCLHSGFGDPVCTDLCHEDEECPDDMYCGEARRQGQGWSAPEGRAIHVCLPMGGRVLD